MKTKPTKWVKLVCRKCGAKTHTKREAYEPAAVKTVVCICPKCDNGGGFDDLQYLDANGKDLGDIYSLSARLQTQEEHK